METTSTTPAREALAHEMQSARALTDDLFGLIRTKALYARPIPERHRLIFYLGHLEAFDWNQICRNALGLPSFHPAFDHLFEFGIDPEVGKAAVDQPSDWPSSDEVRRYNQRARRVISERLADAPEQTVHVAIEHRLMHAETLAYLLHNLPYADKIAPAASAPRSGPRPETPFLEIPSGQAALGRVQDNGFGWDNEFEVHTKHTPAFRIAKYKVTNGEYLDFVRGGALAPHFWAERKGEWFVRGMFREIPLPLDWPVYVTQEQASAYAAWRGKRLMTEAEFHRAAGDGLYPWGDAPPTRSRGNFDFHEWDPVPVDSTPAGDSEYGVSQLAGNGWEWTSTRFEPFPGFRPFPFYPGYSANFFDGRHYVAKGGSPRTAARLLRKSFRNWFRPNYPYIYATFRLVESC